MFTLPRIGRNKLWIGLLVIALSTLVGCNLDTTINTQIKSRSNAENGKQTAIRFNDVSASVAIDFTHYDGSFGERYIVENFTAGLALFDYDCDGNIDVYFLNAANIAGSSTASQHRNALFRNDGNWRFTDVTETAGVGDTGFGLGVVVGDYNNDGSPDLFVNNFGTNAFYRNNGDGTFTEVSEAIGILPASEFGAGASFFDADNDGDLDLYAANYVDFRLDNHTITIVDGIPRYASPRDYSPVPDRLYRNEGDGSFVDISNDAGIAELAAPGMGLIATDYDRDGDADLFVLNDVDANYMLSNDGTGRFSEVGLSTGLAYNGNGDEVGSMGVDCADVNSDGFLDFYMTTYQGEYPVYYKNGKDHFFEDFTQRAGAGDMVFPHVNWGISIVDFENDADRDLFIANGHLQDNVELYEDNTAFRVANSVLENDGTGLFTDVSDSAESAPRSVQSSRGCAFDDLDNDGRVDGVVLNSRESPTLLHNQSLGDNNWLQLNLVGRSVNRNAVGAFVTIKTGARTQVAEVYAGRGYQSHYGSRLHFGLDTATKVDKIRIEWPGGEIGQAEDLDVNQIVTMIEGGSIYPMSTFQSQHAN